MALFKQCHKQYLLLQKIISTFLHISSLLPNYYVGMTQVKNGILYIGVAARVPKQVRSKSKSLLTKIT